MAVSRSSPKELNTRGAEVSSITATVNELRSKGHEVYLITLDFLGPQHDDPDYVVRIACPVKFLYKKNCMAIPWRPKKAVYSHIKKYAPDIIHVHHPFLLGVSALWAAKKLSIPIVFTHHTMYEQYAHYVPLPQWFTKIVTRRLVKKFCAAVDGIIAPSNGIKEYLLAQKIEKPIVVIPSGLRKIFTQGPVAEKKPKEFFDLLYAGRFAAEKNIIFLLDMFKRLPDYYRIMLVGYGPDWEKIKSYTYDDLKLSDSHVRFIYKPDPSTLKQIYGQADLFLFSSKTDTQGLVIAEAMSQSTPVIALDGPGQRDVIIQGHNGFIVQDADGMIEKIEKVRNDAQLLKELSHNAFVTSRNYDPDKLSDKLIEFYKSFKK